MTQAEWNAACEAMRARIYNDFYNEEDFRACDRVINTVLPPLPPQYADPPPVGTHVPGSPHRG